MADDYYDRVHENAKEFVFYTEIGHAPVKVRLDIGWIWIERDKGFTGFGGIAGRRQWYRESLTTKDAKKLADAIYKLIGDEKT